jgi:hypothetical protein
MSRTTPAFPTDKYYDEKRVDCEDGMTLRDYFAAKALIGILGSGDHIDGNGDPQWHTRQAYVYADAMLKAREAK